jgi:uncharacterized protein (TIGR00297 family)
MSGSILTNAVPLLLLFVGFPLHCLGAVVSFWRKSVDAGGAVVGATLGTVILVAAGPLLWLIFAAFVLSSTAFTRFHALKKERFAEIQEKGARRDALQVLANGGVGMLMALLLRLTGEPVFAFAFAASFASANADTWASEIGALSRCGPVSLITFRSVASGTSGGVTVLGLAASMCGALFIALLFAVANASSPPGMAGIAFVAGLPTAAGVFGSILDSLLGCTIQGRYATHANRETERRFSEGRPNTLVRGLPFVTNDVVNFLSIAAAAVVGGLAFILLP